MALAIEGARVLVTGGSGMIGSHVVERLLAAGAGEVVVLDQVIQERNLAAALASGRVRTVAADVRDREALRRVVPGSDAIVHLAAMLMWPARHDPKPAFEINVVASHDLLELAVELGVARFVFASSISVYGAPPDDRPIDEQAPLNARTFYGAGKAAIELFCRALKDMYGLNYIALRLATVYGPRLHPYGFFPRFLLSILDQVDRGEVPVVEGDPREVNDVIYVGDVADAVARAVAADASDVAVNIVSGSAITLDEFYGTLLDVYGAPRAIRWQARPFSYVTRRRFSGALAEQLLGFRASTSLADGLRAFVAWRQSVAGGT